MRKYRTGYVSLNSDDAKERLIGRRIEAEAREATRQSFCSLVATLLSQSESDQLSIRTAACNINTKMQHGQYHRKKKVIAQPWFPELTLKTALN
jgi:hypothetical protein